MKPHAKKPSAYQALISPMALIRTMGLLVLAICFSSSVWAQLRIVGAISGTVQDQTGAVIANAGVTLKDEKTGITRQATTTEQGTFLLPDLASGTYEVNVTATGFQTAVVNKIAVSTSQTGLKSRQ